ncbi:MAG: hypothetical protein EOP56_08535 [Sphingobacteriales bacterium]|nr:MAG: hypothetical protein EOP56_08535 [Sphingobacteriales bacterium]
MSNYRFIILLVLLHALFFAMALYFKRIYNGDSHEYIYMALNVKEHFWFYAGNPALPVTEEYMTIRAPGYPLFLLLVYLFSVNNWTVLVLQNIISMINIYYLRNTIRRIGYTRKYDFLLIALIALFPSQFINANTIAPDILLQTCVLVYFRHFVLMVRYKKWEHAGWMTWGLVAGLFVKPVLYPFVFCHLAIMLYMYRYLRGSRLIPTINGILPIACISLYMLWNYQRTDKLHFTSNQSFNAIYYYYFYYNDTYGREKADQFLKQERDKIEAMPKFADRYDYANQRGLQLLKENFAPYMSYHIRQGLRMFIDPGKGELDMFTGSLTLGKLYDSKAQDGFWVTIKKDGWDGLEAYAERNPSFPIAMVILAFNIIRLVGLMLFAFASKINKRIRMFTFLFLTYFAFTTGAIAHTRYLVPVSLIVIGCSVMGYQLSLQRLKNKAIIAKYKR